MRNRTRLGGIILIAYFVLLAFPLSLKGQITLQVGGGLGIVRPGGDYGGSTIEYYRGTKYGFSDGVNLHGKLRLGLIGFTLVAEVDYSILSNDGYSEPGQGSVEISQKVVSLKAGPEFQLKLPAFPITPYAGANVAVNTFNGETTFQGVSKVPSATYSVQSASRVGFGIGAGLIVRLNPSLSLDVGLQYNLMNPMGRTWVDVNPLQDQRLDSYLALNDEKDPAFLPGNDKHFISSARSIRCTLVTVTLLFGL